MLLNKGLYRIIVAILVVFHIPLFIMSNQFIEFGDASYPVPVLLIVVHTWLWLESRTVFVDERNSIHLYGILTGVLGFLPGLMFHIIPNVFVVIIGLRLLGKYVTEDKNKRERRKEMEKDDKSKNKLVDLIERFRGDKDDK